MLTAEVWLRDAADCRRCIFIQIDKLTLQDLQKGIEANKDNDKIDAQCGGAEQREYFCKLN